jgi:gamma-glutamyltranspeptidase
MDPQAALDRARFRVEGHSVHLEPPLWHQEQSIVKAGLRPIRSPEISSFGGGQAIFVAGEALIGGSDARKDGLAAGL